MQENQLGYIYNSEVVWINESPHITDCKDAQENCADKKIHRINDNPKAIFESVTLTEDQKNAKRVLLNSVSEPNSYAVLTGYAGTGKTTLITNIIKTLIESDVRVQFAAPTHKAVSVAANMLRRAGIECDCLTIHKTFGIRLSKALDGTEKLTAPNKNVRGVLIVDEASMIDSVLYKIIVSHADRVIFVGDPAQLPPVNAEPSPVLTDTNNRAHLSQVMRQALDNPIISLATWIRKLIEKGQTITAVDVLAFCRATDPEEYKIGLHPLDTIPEITKSAVDAGFDCRVLAYSNIASSRWGRAVKQEITGNQLPINNGDPVLFNEAQIMYFNDGTSRVIAENNQDAMVLTASDPFVDDKTSIKVQRVTLTSIGQAFLVPVDIAEFKALKKKLQNELNTINLMAKAPGGLQLGYSDQMKMLKDKLTYLNNNYADLRLNWSMTIHKSQGSTFDAVVIDLPDLFRMDKREVLRGLYVACTRPSRYLILAY